MERTFLLRELPEDIKGLPSTFVEISYLCMKPAVLLVQKGDEYYIGEVDRRAYTFDLSCLKPIDSAIYAALADVVKANMIRCEVYQTNLSTGYQVRINRFLDENDNLSTVAVSFDTYSQSEEFEIPSWFGEELISKSDYIRAGFVLKNRTFTAE